MRLALRPREVHVRDNANNSAAESLEVLRDG